MAGLKIVGLGRSMGSKLYTNRDMEELTETSHTWIKERTGICQRYFADKDKKEENLDFALGASRAAILDGKIDKDSIGVVIVATFTPDYYTPSMACRLAKKLDLRENIMALDINAACTGFLYGLEIGKSLLENRENEYALIVGSEKISDFLDMEDPKTSVLFGDGAGASVVKVVPTEENPYAFTSGCIADDEVLYCSRADGKIKMDGRAVYRFAVEIIPKIAVDLGGTEDVEYFVCHQANGKIIENAIKRLKENPEKFYINLNNYGNTSAASIPIALSEMKEKGLLEKGKKVICAGFGAGLTYGGALLSW